MLSVIANLKGGVGKSTVSFNLAVWLLETGQKTVLFDLDPQQTLSDAIDVRMDEGYQPLLTAYKDLSDLDRVIEYKSDLQILVDTSGSDMDAMLDTISMADRVLIPVLPSQADIWSTQRFIKIIRQRANAQTTEILVFINRADTHHAVRETDEAVVALSMLPGIRLLDEKLYQRTAYRRSFSEGLAVFEMGPLSKAGQEVMHLAEALYR